MLMCLFSPAGRPITVRWSRYVSVPAGSDPAGRIGWHRTNLRYHKKAEAVQKQFRSTMKDLLTIFFLSVVFISFS